MSCFCLLNISCLVLYLMWNNGSSKGKVNKEWGQENQNIKIHSKNFLTELNNCWICRLGAPLRPWVEQMEATRSIGCSWAPAGKANDLRSWSLANLFCSSSLRLIKVLERQVLCETRRLEPDNFWGLFAPKFGDYHGRDWVKAGAGI